MPTSIRRRVAATSGFLLLGSFVLLAAPPAAEPLDKRSGELWEVTTQMSMDQIPTEIPPQTMQVCAATDWKEPPGLESLGQNCKVSDFKTTDTTGSWTMSCAGPPVMTGVGQITRTGSDAYDGSIKLASKEGNLTIKLSGHRVGDCDAPAA